MNELFIPFDTGIPMMMKDRGFKKTCFTYWYKHTGIHHHQLRKQDLTFRGYINQPESNTVAPTYQQAVDWLRDEHKLIVYVEPYKDHASDNNDPLEWNWTIYNHAIGRGLTSYYEALTDGIYEALKRIPKNN
jgi:hypothetical protein